MAADARHHLAGPDIHHLLSDRMCKFPLGLMAPRADGIAIPPEHGQLVGTMDFMTACAYSRFHFRMPVKLVFVAGNGIIVTAAADMQLAAFEQILFIPGMGGMTGDAFIFLLARQVTVPGKHSCRHGFMTPEATLRTASFPALLMAFFATLRKWRMQHVADHALSIAAMGVMTGKTSLQTFRIIHMPLLQVLGLVAGETHLVRFVLQQLTICRLMGTMTGVTLPLSKRAVGILEFLRYFFMAGETGCAQLLLEQPISVAGMGFMADEAISTAHRLMNHALLE